jgi:hypothetical protein
MFCSPLSYRIARVLLATAVVSAGVAVSTELHESITEPHCLTYEAPPPVNWVQICERKVVA